MKQRLRALFHCTRTCTRPVPAFFRTSRHTPGFRRPGLIADALWPLVILLFLSALLVYHAYEWALSTSYGFNTG